MTLRRLLVFAAACAGIAAIAIARSPLAATASAVKERSEVFPLPPPRALKPVSFGYRSALADLIWAHILVTQGLRASEGRPFLLLDRYFDSVNELDPAFTQPYRLAHSLLAFQRNDPDPAQSARSARRILERGLREHPNDSKLWMDYGEFLAYVAPPLLQDDTERQRWKVEGARALVRAGELGSKDDNLYWHSISAVGILTKEGEREAMLRFLRRVHAMTEDSELKRFIAFKLGALEKSTQDARDFLYNQRFEELWRRTTPFAGRGVRRVLGPDISVPRCAGPLSLSQTDSCSRDWRAWSRATLGDVAPRVVDDKF